MPFTPFDPMPGLTAVAVTLTDLRASLEAQLRAVGQAQDSIALCQIENRCEVLAECRQHVEELLRLMPESRAALGECLQALAAAMPAQTTPPEPTAT